MKRNIIALDLDGTLLNGEGEISKRNKEAVSRLVLEGHIPVLATGRPYRGMIHFYEELNLNTPLITDNGGLVMNPHDETFKTYQHTLPRLTSDRLFNHIKEHIISAYYSVDDVIYVYNRREDVDRFMHLKEGNVVVEGPYDDPQFHTPYGIVYFIQRDFCDEFERFVKEECSLINTRMWGASKGYAVYEIYHESISKASSLALVAKHYGIEPSHIIAFGDGINDFELLSYAGVGVAMGNASDELKSIADDIANSHLSDGVAEWLYTHFFK